MPRPLLSPIRLAAVLGATAIGRAALGASPASAPSAPAPPASAPAASAPPAESQPSERGHPEVARAGEPRPADGGDLTSLSLEDLMKVEVRTVSRQKQRASEAPAAVTVVTQEDIRRSGMTTIPDLLRLVPGMEVARQDANKWDVSARGFNETFSNKLLVQMDGRSVYTPLFGGVFWDTQDYVLQDLEQIEVVRGPGATLWGSNAVNGVISIQSKSARDTQGVLLTGLGGDFEQSGAARYGGKIDDDTYYRVYTKYRNFNSFDTLNPAGVSGLFSTRPHDGWESAHTGFRVDRYASPDDTLTLEGEYFAESFNQIDADKRVTPPLIRSLRDDGTSDGGNLLARWTHTVSPTSDLSLQVYYDRLDRYETFYGFQQDTLDVDFQHRFALGKGQEVTWGLGSRVVTDRWAARGLFLAEPRDRTIELISAFAQDDFTLAPDRLHLIAGTKLEYNTYTHFEVEPSGKLLWTPDERNTVWGSISRATRTPTRHEEDAVTTFSVVPAMGQAALAAAVPNQDLRSEAMTAFEAGYRARLAKNLTLDVSGFYNAYDNLVGLQALPPFEAVGAVPHLVAPQQWRNNLKGQTYGGEVAATWNVSDNWRLTGSYSFLKVHAQPDGAPNNNSVLGFFETTNPEHQFQLRSYLNLTRDVELNAAVYFVGPLQEQHIPAYVRGDVGVTWRPRENVELSLWVQNLFDNRHPEAPDEGAYTLASQTPRSVYGQLAVRF